MTSSKLSIGVPAYNHGNFLAETLESLLNQQTAPDEIVVCDNHSTDNTAAILESFGDKIRVISPPQHLPMMANWNHLVGEMKSEWVALVSSDDLARPNYVESILEGMGLSNDAVLVGGQHGRIDGEGNPLGTPSKLPTGISSPGDNLAARLHSPLNSFNGTAFRHDAWQMVGGFPEELKLAGDWGFWIRLCPYGDFITIRETVVDYRVDYRSEQEDRARIMIWAMDYQQLYRNIMPRARQQCEGVTMKQIDTAMRIRCHNFLRGLSRSLDSGERAALTKELESWAEDCGVPDSLEKLRTGKRLNRYPFRKLKQWISGW